MAEMTEIKDRVADAARRQTEQYAGGAVRPLGGYVATMGAYAGVVAGLAGLARLTRRPVPARVEPWDVALVACATHRLSRMITKDSVMSPLRAPFTSYEGPAGPAEVNEQVRDHGGVRHAVGELVTCPFCMGMWVATGFAAGLVFFPRLARLGAATFTALDAADFLQFAYAAAEKSSR
jgi:Protein of unknown function (DUF1360)